MDVNKLITLKLIGFNELEQSNLKSILTLGARALHHEWQLVDSAMADFFLLSVASTAQFSNNDSLKSLPKARCIFCITDNQVEADYVLKMDEKRIPGLRALADLLNRAGAEITDTVEPVIQTKAEPVAVVAQTDSPAPAQSPSVVKMPVEQAESGSFFEPQQGLLGHLLQPQAHYQVITLNHQIDCLALYLDMEKKVYYSHNSLEQLDAYVCASDEMLFIKSYDEEEFNECIVAESLKAQPIKNLLWCAGICLSKGKVIKAHAPRSIITLKSWPDLRLPKCMDYAKLAAFMKNNAATLELIAQHTQFPLADVHDFYNACYLIGIVGLCDEIVITKK